MPEGTTQRDAWPALMSDATAAAYLEISPRQVWKLAAEKKLPAPVSIPGSRSSRWRKEDLDRFVDRLK